MTPREILLRAAELVERGWCQEAYARDAKGREVASSDPVACCYCPVGAIRAAAGIYGKSEALKALRDLLDRSAVAWNDAPGRMQAEVVEALRRAAEGVE